MTRDEAIEIEKKCLAKAGYTAMDIDVLAHANIDALIELGLLKVDEPRRIVKFAGGEFCLSIEEINDALFFQNIGYKLVKK